MRHGGEAVRGENFYGRQHFYAFWLVSCDINGGHLWIWMGEGFYIIYVTQNNPKATKGTNRNATCELSRAVTLLTTSRDVILTSNQRWNHEGFVGFFSHSPVCVTYILRTYVWNYPDPYFRWLYLHCCNYTLDYIIIYRHKSMLPHRPHVPAVEAVGGKCKNDIHSSKWNYKQLISNHLPLKDRR